MIIKTIGYSVKTIDEFISKLKENKIDLVVDVRTRPYSRWNPKFSRQSLELKLIEHSIKYLFRGNNLGGLGENINYEDAIDELVSISSLVGLVVMCTESEPENCHRLQMLTPSFESRGVKVVHIRWDKPTKKS